MSRYTRFFLPALSMTLIAPVSARGDTLARASLSQIEASVFVSKLSVAKSADGKQAILLGSVPEICLKEEKGEKPVVISLAEAKNKDNALVKGWRIEASKTARECVAAHKDKTCGTDGFACVSLSTLSDRLPLANSAESFSVGLIWTDLSADVNSPNRDQAELFADKIEIEGATAKAARLKSEKIKAAQTRYDNNKNGTTAECNNNAQSALNELFALEAVTKEEFDKEKKALDDRFPIALEHAVKEGPVKDVVVAAGRILAYVNGSATQEAHPGFAEDAARFMKIAAERLVEESEEDDISGDVAKAKLVLDYALQLNGISGEAVATLNMTKKQLDLQLLQDKASRGKFSQADMKKLMREAQRLAKRSCKGLMTSAAASNARIQRGSTEASFANCSFAQELQQQALQLYNQSEIAKMHIRNGTLPGEAWATAGYRSGLGNNGSSTWNQYFNSNAGQGLTNQNIFGTPGYNPSLTSGAPSIWNQNSNAFQQNGLQQNSMFQQNPQQMSMTPNVQVNNTIPGMPLSNTR